MSGSKLSEGSNDARREPAADHVLDMTVYSLPEPVQAMAAEERRTRVGRWKMLAVLAVCAAPVIASYYTYYVVRPQGRGNFGALVEPQRPLPELAAMDLEGHVRDLRTLKGQWLLVTVGSGACDQACQQRLYLQRQLHESLGKDRDRVDVVWLVSDTRPIAPEVLQAIKGATVLRVPQEGLLRWLAPAAGHDVTEHLYVVDPMGHWMMRFPPDMDIAAASKAKRDLERLLRASSSWDRAGR